MKKQLYHGISSFCADKAHVCFFDFDTKSIEPISIAIKLVQEEWDLGNVYLFQTPNGFHGVCLDKFTLPIVQKIYDSFGDIVDDSHRTVGPQWFGRWVLRISDDITYYKTFERKSKNQKSNAHRLYFVDIQGADIPDDGTFDEFDDVILEVWELDKYGKNGIGS